MKKALVLDGAQRSALAVARSLGRHGVEVIIVDAKIPCLAGCSRYVKTQLSCPDPLLHPQVFLAWLDETVQALSIDMVFPITDATTMLLAPKNELAGRVKFICAPSKAYESVTDKHHLLQLAERVGVLTPATTVAFSLAEVESYLVDANFPLVLKPARSRVVIDGQIVSTAVYIARTQQDALRYIYAQTWLGPIPCLMQEYIEGHGAGIFALYSNGRPQAWFSHRRIREKPPRGGVSVLSESALTQPLLREAAERLLNEAQWEGPAMVEFRISRDGTPYLMEINGRLWGSLQLAIDSGVDFPWLMFQAAISERVDLIDHYALGKQLRWFLGDVDNLLLELRGKGLSTTSSQRLCCMGRFILNTLNPTIRGEILRSDDPRPAVFELKQWLKNLA